MKHLSTEQQATLRKVLEEKLKRLTAYSEHVESESPAHDPDRDESNEIGDDASESYGIFESEALVEASTEIVDEIRAALDRMNAGTYGLDIKTGEVIAYERLLMFPEARTAHGE